MDNTKASELLRFQVERMLINQSKSFLVILEDLLEETKGFNYNRKRKVVLDTLNNNLREFTELVSKLDISLK